MRAPTRPVDVICQHNSDKKIIPLRIRFKNDDGMSEVLTIRSYKDFSHAGRELADGIFCTTGDYAFQCRVVENGKEKVIWLHYSQNMLSPWLMAVVN